ncbi:MAG: hypothetical protein Kow00105_00830 [Phycisphaeraceae bacterium]
MFTRHYLAVAVVVCGLAAGLPALLAQENGPTASELYEQGVTLFESGDLEAARDTLRRVDPMQLPKEARLKYYDTIKTIDQTLNAPAVQLAEEAADTADAAAAEAEQVEAQVDAAEAELQTDAEAPVAEAVEEATAEAEATVEEETEAVAEVEQTEEAPAAKHPSQLLWEADQAMAENPSLAASLYQAVLDDPRTDELTASQAKARMLQAQRLAEPAINEAREHLDLATEALEAGRYDVAANHVAAVKSSGVVLGWREADRLDRLVTAIQAHETAIPDEPVEPAEEVKELPSYDAQAEPAPEADVAPVATVVDAEQVSAPTEAETEQAQVEQAEAEEQAPSDDLLLQVRLGYAQQKIAEADQAQADGQLRLAIELYKQALELDPDNAEAKQKLDAAIALQNKALVPQGLVDEIVKREQVKAQEVTAEFNRAMNVARQRVSERDFASAFDAVADAKVVLDRNQRFLPPETYRGLRSEAETLAAEIEAQRAQAAAEAVKQQETEQARKEAEARKAVEKQKDEEIQSLLRRALDLQRDMKYDQALDLLDQALFLDPNDVAVNAIKEMIEEAKILVESREIRRRRDLARARQSNINDETAIPYEEIMTYPADWPQITYTRLAGLDENAGETEADRETANRLKQAVPINFEANRLANVIDYLRNTTGANFFVNWPVLEAAGVDQDTLITLNLTNVPAEQALELVLRQVGSEFDPIGYSIIDGIVTISTVRDLSRTTDTRVYDIRDLLVQVPNFTNAPSFDLNEALSNTNSGGSGGGGGGGGGGGQSIFGDTDDEEDEELPTRQELIDQITTLITETVGDFNEWSINGGDVSSLDELNGNLVVKTTPDNHRDISALLAQLREIRSGQISVEARFLLVDESFLEETGFDFDFQINDIGSSFGPIRFAQDSVSIAGRRETAIRSSPFPQPEGVENAGPGLFVPGTGFTPVTGRAADFSLSFLEDIEVNLLVRATQANQRSLTLTAPRITLSNGQRAYVTVATQRSFVSDLEPIPDSVGFDPTLSVTQSGVVLDVEGTISADRRYVTLTLRPSLATIVNIRSVQTSGEGQGAGGGGGVGDDGGNIIVNLPTGTIEAPELEITSAATTVSIPDQGTLLIGGQRLVGEVEVEAGVPVLSKIPVFNRLFSNNSITKDQRTLLILVKPTIILQSEIEDQQFPGLMQDPARFNISNTLR